MKASHPAADPILGDEDAACYDSGNVESSTDVPELGPLYSSSYATDSGNGSDHHDYTVESPPRCGEDAVIDVLTPSPSKDNGSLSLSPDSPGPSGPVHEEALPKLREEQGVLPNLFKATNLEFRLSDFRIS